ncbi:MAG: methyltransferase, partial [Trueperella pyogenes]|nr:methyltransferase [Trueperella pyogenes]
HDQVADPAQRDEQTVMMREIAKVLGASEEFIPAMLPVGDGLLAAVKRR